MLLAGLIAFGIAAAFVVLLVYNLRRGLFAIPEAPPEMTNSCAWARALYFNGLISIEELNRFMHQHGKCATCLPTGEENANSNANRKVR